MASRRAKGRLGKLWQMPLLVVSLGLFGYAAWLFIDPKFGPTISQRIAAIETLLKLKRFEAALDVGNKLLATDKLKPAEEAHVHSLLARVLEEAQKENRISLPSNHQRIIEQTKMALAEGEKETADLYRRLGESQEALDHPVDALVSYRKAITIDPAAFPALSRKVIELELAQQDLAPSQSTIETYLKIPNLPSAERAWGLTKKGEALIKRGLFAEARPVLLDALRADPDPAASHIALSWLGLPTLGAPSGREQAVAQGMADYWLGYCNWKLGESDEAERILRVARDLLTVAHPLDADAAFLLGRIRQEKNDPTEAISFFQDVLRSHPESMPAPLAKLRRGLCRITLDDDDAGLSDLHTVVTEVETKKNREAYQEQVVEGLKEASAALAAKENLTGAIEALESEQLLVTEPPAEFYGRLAKVFEQHADQIEQTLSENIASVERIKREGQVRKFRTHAADAYIALSRGLTLADDRGQGEAMWKGVDLYDRAGAMPQSIGAMETFIAERPDDSSTPDVLLRLGRSYQATGQFDKAIAAFQREQFRYPQSLAASKSGVPLAQAFTAKGPASYPKAEKALLSVLENPIITPEAEEFRLALFELAQLYYRTGRYEDAITRLEETAQRYPSDPRLAQLLFLMGDSYRKSAELLSEKADAPSPLTQPGAAPPDPIAAAAAAAVKAEAIAARRDRLTKARALFGRIVDLSRGSVPEREIDRLHLKLAHFYRADCFYDLGEYEEAIRHYDAAALRYQDDPSSVAAYVQIVNCYCRLGRLDDAHTANERAKWLLRKMPAEAFAEGKLSVPKKYWDDWLRLTGESGIYAKDLLGTPVSDAR
jgi:tetratricopeptide (TPR) repeat protein